VFQIDVVKINWDVVYVAMVVHVCCKGLLPIFHLCFLDAYCKCVYLDVVYVSHICCMYFIWIFHMFAMVFKCFHVFFQVFHKHVSSVLSAFRRMLQLQLLHLDVLKADQVLHLSSSPSTTSYRCVLLALARHPYDAVPGSFRIGGAAPFPSCHSGEAGPAWSARHGVQRASVRPDIRALTLPILI
jgi:hypothetical protein